MSKVYTILKKEFFTYFNSPAGYIFITVFLVLSSWFYMRSLFIFNQADMRSFFTTIPWILLLLVPAVSMKMWAEERKLGTVELLLTWPVKDWESVLGKFLGSLAFVLVAMLGSLVIPIILSTIGNPDWGAIIVSYIGAFLLAATYLAIGLWSSSITDNQIVAFIIGIAIMFVLFMMGSDAVLLFAPEGLGTFFRYLSLGTHFDSISRGVIDSRDILYYFSMIGFFLFLNVKTIQERNWK